jgi:hypothetical protein
VFTLSVVVWQVPLKVELPQSVSLHIYSGLSLLVDAMADIRAQNAAVLPLPK